MWKDLRFALRLLRRSPGFTAIAVVSLALGIGANTAIFSLVDRVLLRNLPVPEPHRLVILDYPETGPGMTSKDNQQPVFSVPMYRELREGSAGVLSGLAARGGWPVTLSWNGNAESAYCEMTSGNYFTVLGVRPALGRTYTDAEDGAPGAHPVAVVTWGYWRKRFGADPKLVGSSVELNGRVLTVIGILGPAFTSARLGEPPDVMVPLAMQRAVTPSWDVIGEKERSIRFINLIGRLAPGVSAAQAEARMQGVWRPALERDVASNTPRSERRRERYLTQRLRLVPAAQGINEMAIQWTDSLLALMSMVALVLLIACANVANLMIARASARKREFAVRLSLGASLWPLVRQLLVESALLAGAAGLLGLLVATWVSDGLLRALDSADNLYLAFRPDARILLFTLAVSALTAVLFGLAPAFQSRRLNLADALRATASSVAGGGSRLRKIMVAAEIALAVVLLVSAVLFSRSFYRLMSVNPGFRTEHVTTFNVDPTLMGYDQAHTRQFYGELLRRFHSSPGIAAVAMAIPGPFSDTGRGSGISIDGYKPAEEENLSVGARSVSPGYFRAMGTPLLLGREFTNSDAANSRKVMVVDQTFARRFFGKDNPLGRRVAWGAGDKHEIEIVGVVADMAHLSLTGKHDPVVYVPYTQDPMNAGAFFYLNATRDLSREIRETVRSLEPRVPVARLRSLEKAVADSVKTERLIAAISTAFGALAVLLAAIGVYGVVSYAVVRRTSEIGVRIALGAQRSHVLAVVLREVMAVSATGLAVGLLLSLAAGSVIRNQLFGIAPHDPATLVSAALLLACLAFAAAWFPARRAARIDPIRALRCE